jgi:flavin-dependent dehydrogenase
VVEHVIVCHEHLDRREGGAFSSSCYKQSSTAAASHQELSYRREAERRWRHGMDAYPPLAQASRPTLIHEGIGRPSHAVGGDAIVVGAGIAGVLTASALADHFERVIVLERDPLPSEPADRRSVPHAHHSHVLGGTAAVLFERLLPGFSAELEQAGAIPFDHLLDYRVYDSGRVVPTQPSGLTSFLCTRRLLEWAMRRRLLALRANVSIRDQFRVSDVVASPNRGRVVGLRGQSSGGRSDEVVNADLVVDAAGRGSRLRRWIAELGYGTVEQTATDLRGGFATRLYRAPPDLDVGWKALLVKPQRGNPRMGVVAKIEGSLLRASLRGADGILPGRDPEGFMEFVRLLPHPSIHEVIRDAEPVSPVYYFGGIHSIRTHFERMRRFPDGIVAIGDSFFHANPDYAQGMTYCAMGAIALAGALAADEKALRDRLGFSLAFHRELARVYQPHWVLNWGADFLNDGITGDTPPLLTRARQAYFNRVRRLAATDARVQLAFMRVVHAARSTYTLFHPRIALRVAIHVLRQLTGRLDGVTLRLAQRRERRRGSVPG